jgi:hypothetical protein
MCFHITNAIESFVSSHIRTIRYNIWLDDIIAWEIPGLMRLPFGLFFSFDLDIPDAHIS